MEETADAYGTPILGFVERFRRWLKPGNHAAASEKQDLHVFIGFSFMANYLLVTCYLGFPYAFFHGGILASILAVAVVCLASRITADWVLEVTARAQVCNFVLWGFILMISLL